MKKYIHFCILFLVIIISCHRRSPTQTLIESILNTPGTNNIDFKLFPNCETEELHSYDTLVLKEISKLVQEGADPNAKVNDSTPLLLYAVNERYAPEALALIQNGADPNIYGEYHRSPLFQSIMNGMFVIAQELVKAGADINARESLWNATPLMASVYYAYLNGRRPPVCFVRFLLENGADVNMLDRNGSSPLILSMQYVFEDIIDRALFNDRVEQTVDLLLEYDPELNIKDSLGNSPLGLALMRYLEPGIRAGLYLKGARLACEQRHGNIQLEPMMFKAFDSDGTYDLYFYQNNASRGRFICDSCQTDKFLYPCNYENVQ